MLEQADCKFCVFTAGPLYGGFLYEAGGIELPFLIGAGLLAIDGCARILVAEPAPSVSKQASAGTIADSAADQPSLAVLPSEAASDASIEAGVGNDDVDSLSPNGDDAPPAEHVAGAATLVQVSGADEAGDSSAKTGVSAPLASNAENGSGVTVSAPTTPMSYASMLRHKQIMVLTGALLVGNGGIALMEVVLPLYLANVMNFSSGQIGGLYAGGNLLYVLMAQPMARFGTRVGRWKVVAVGLICMGVPMPLMPMVESVFWIVPLWLVCSGLGMSFVDVSCNPELADVVDRTFPGQYGRVYAIAQVGVAFGFIVGPLIGTSLAEHVSFQASFLSFSVVVVAFAPVVVWGFRGWRSTHDLELEKKAAMLSHPTSNGDTNDHIGNGAKLGMLDSEDLAIELDVR